jgi:hypothetical protein
MRSMHHNEGGEMGSAMGSRRDRRMNSNGAQRNGTTDLKETQVSQCSRHVTLFTTTTQLISLVCFRNSSLSVLTTYDAFHHNHPIDCLVCFFLQYLIWSSSSFCNIKGSRNLYRKKFFTMKLQVVWMFINQN